MRCREADRCIYQARSACMLTAFLDDIRDGDLIAPRRMAERLRLPMTCLSRIAHLNRNTMTAHPASPTVQAKLGEIARSEEHTSELQSLMRISYAVFCLKKKTKIINTHHHN